MPSGSAIVIPQKSELAGGNVGIMQIAKCLVVVDSIAPDTDVADIILASGDSAAVQALFTFPNGAFIWDVGWKVETAFTASVTLTLGDTDDADGWGAAAMIGATAADTEMDWSSRQVMITRVGGVESTAITYATDTTQANLTPYYGIHHRTMVMDTIGDNIDLNLTVGGAVPATGVLQVWVTYFLPFGKNST